MISGGEGEGSPTAGATTTVPGDVAEAETARPEPERLEPISATVSSASSDARDRCDDLVTYDGANVWDRRADTAWQVYGDGPGHHITFEFPPGTTVTQVGLVAGYDKVDPCGGIDRFLQNHRVDEVRWRLGGTEEVQRLDVGRRRMQYHDVDPTDVTQVTMEIGSIVRGDPSGDTAISEIAVIGYTTGEADVATGAAVEGPDHGLPMEELAVAFVRALVEGPEDPARYASQAVLDDLRRDEAYPVLMGMSEDLVIALGP